MARSPPRPVLKLAWLWRRGTPIVKPVERAQSQTVAHLPVPATPTTRPRRHSRGWLVRRALLCADLIGLILAFVVSEIALGDVFNRVHPDVAELFVFFVLSLPAWVVAAKLYGLYDRDEERTDH